IPYPDKTGDQLRWGVPCLVLALLFLLAFLRNEDDPGFRNLAHLILGGVGALMCVGGLLAGNVRGQCLLHQGLIFCTIVAVYILPFVGSRGISEAVGYRAAGGLAVLGALVVVVALGRSMFGTGAYRYFTSYGLIFILVGILYVLAGACTALDWPFFVL